ncbi:MAG: transglutaminase domain-containing protein, partial [Duncaniella sp.]|nr:transglutaminase domain-containing protein [Duncaniella sp.]
ARSMGIPSRIAPVTGKTQYADGNGKWIDVKLAEEVIAPSTPKGRLALSFSPLGRTVDPKYYSQFTLSKIENGLPRLLEYEETDTYKSITDNGLELDEGRYALITGQRMADGGVLARVDIFNINAGTTAERQLKIRQDSTEVQVIGSFNSENLYHDLESDTDKSLLSTTGRGYYILGLIQPNHEPTAHNLNDISALAAEFEKRGNKMVLLFADESEAARFDKSRFPSLPSNMVLGTDLNGTILREVTANLNLPSSERPIFIIADTFNRVVFLSQGYTIGLGETLTDILHRID